MTDLNRKRLELEQKVHSLAVDFAQWRSVSEAGQPLEKHHTQIRRVARQLEAAQGPLIARIEQAAAEGTLLGVSFDLEADVLELHRIWDFFRSKFALRHVAWFRPFLTAADELAWACYRPAVEKAVAAGQVSEDQVKEPPLLFLTGHTTPFEMSRNVAYHSEVPTEAGVGIEAFANLLKALPLSVIGVPWYQLAHLPEAVVVGHEAGHAVEDDLDLSAAMTKRLADVLDAAGVPPERQGAWQAWRGEVFADGYGTLATGPAYVGAQADFLASDARTIREEAPGRDWGGYPTTYLRMLFVLEVLDRLGHTDEATRRRTAWRTEYPRHALPEFEADVPLVADALIEGTFLGGVPLHQTMAFTPADLKKAKKDAGRVLKNYKPMSGDVRTLIASARLAFEEDPSAYVQQHVDARILHRIGSVMTTGVRSSTRGRAAAEARLAQHDEAAGAGLLNVLATHRNASQPPAGADRST